MQELNQTQIAQRLHLLTEVSVALGDSHDIEALLDRILTVAKGMTGADGGTMYRPSDDRKSLCFHISINDTLEIYQGGASGKPIDLAPVALFDSYGNKNVASVAAYAANFSQSVNIEDVYKADVFNFSGMRSFDAAYGYHSQSFLTVPMTDHEGELVGVLQLVNATDRETGAIRAFNQTDQRFIEALAAQAAVAITNQQLIGQLEELLEALVNLINIGMAIADIFEALTARDRPYKKGKPLSESLRILGNFALNGYIDPDLFDIFIRKKVYLEFARKNMDERQIDAVDEALIPGYRP
jgi:GAF domain-containing protein